MTLPAGSETPQQTNTLGAALIGGASRRMGQDKLTLTLPDGQLLLARTVGIARSLCRSVVLLGKPPVSNPLQDNLPPVWEDESPGAGPLQAIAGAMRRSEQPWLLILACDIPLLEVSTLQQVRDAYHPGCNAMIPTPAGGGKANPICAFYHRDLYHVAQAQLADGDRSVMSFIRRCNVAYVQVDPDRIASGNTPQEWDRLTRSDKT